MSHIFVSHSQKDKEIISLFSMAFGSTPVRAVFMEFEKMMDGKIVNPEDIRNQIKNATAVFILLSKNVNDISHTRDWIVWESGLAASLGKEIWVFEPTSDFGKINVVIPGFTHFVPIDVDIKQSLAYLRAIIESYDDSQMLSSAAAFGFLGAIGGTMLASPRQREDAAVAGAALGGFFGLIMGTKQNLRPMGISTQCIYCKRVYHVHVPFEYEFRCPGCNNNLRLIQTGQT
ncbi:MAG: hypothetical protein ABSG49_08880 [Methanoregula sp.]|jgi:hypothetical protein|uniref:hypothetical protein n=1 Tax=Methanoregula sp. TaxID=2052170 RepID=UPI003C254D0A